MLTEIVLQQKEQKTKLF